MARRAEEPDFRIEETILDILRRFVAELGMDHAVQAVSLDAALDRDLGLGSLERVELLLRIEKAFSTRIPDPLAAGARTPRDLARAILQAKGPLRPLSTEHLPSIGEASPPPASAATLTEVLIKRAEAEPDRPHIYLPQEEGEEEKITYRGLLEAGAATAKGLLERGIHRGDTVALMLPTGGDFFGAFFGILLAGGIPAPLYPPFRVDQIEDHTRRQAAILRKAEARFLVIWEEVGGLARLLRPLVPTLAGVATADALRRPSAQGTISIP
ncbi:MAG TPA: AMP-binding protein, partial [Candidatus Manganitrophaceae bacterium]